MDPTNTSGDAGTASAPAPADAPAPAAPPAAAPTPAAAPASTLLTAAAEAAAAPKPEGEGGAGATDEQKPEGEAKPDAKKAEGEGAPEEYEPFKLDEGQQLDDEFLGAFKPLAKELGLPQDKAEKLAQLGARESQRLAGKFVTDLQTRVDENAKAWETAVKADPELGGSKHDEVMAVAVKALETFGSPELKSFLAESRLGSNPELIRLLYRAGKAISQDGVPTGRASAPTKSDADVFYGTTA